MECLDFSEDFKTAELIEAKDNLKAYLSSEAIGERKTQNYLNSLLMGFSWRYWQAFCGNFLWNENRKGDGNRW